MTVAGLAADERASWHAGLPWGAVRHWFRRFRAAFFSAPRPSGEYLVVGDPDGVAEALGRRGFAPNWEQSYHKRGEDLNLARVVYSEDERGVWWQTHARGWRHDDGSLWLTAHWELEPTEHPRGHLEGDGTDPSRGNAVLADFLSDAGVAFERRRWDG